jgi:ATP-dependent DNA helicase DinG
LTENKILTLEDYLSVFPFPEVRPKQRQVLQEICDAFNSGYKIIALEAPTGFGKSPVAIAIGRTSGTSYICSATKELQTQYMNDFPFLRTVKGMCNYECLVREDFINNRTYECGKCGKIASHKECTHKSVVYGPCRSGDIGFKHEKNVCSICDMGVLYKGQFHNGCRYKTFSEDYSIKNQGTDKEDVFINPTRLEEYRKYSTNSDSNSSKLNSWMHFNGLKRKAMKKRKQSFTPCPYYDQLNKGIAASHSIFNYANFQIFLRMQNNNGGGSGGVLPSRDLLVLDEGHQIETQVVDHIGISISKRELQKFIPTSLLENTPLGYESDIKQWIDFLSSLYKQVESSIPGMRSKEIKIEAHEYLQKVEWVMDLIAEDPDNWIVSNIEREKRSNLDELFGFKDHENDRVAAAATTGKEGRISRVEFKPLDVSPYCKKLFAKCDRTLIMSATILNIDTFCRNIGLDRENVKFIEAGSDFPVENRPIHAMNIAHLNFKTLELEEVQQKIANAVDNVMTLHSHDKGIIHTTSYRQVDFIEKYLSQENRKRLIRTDPHIPREQIVEQHKFSSEPKVLISPSLHTGLDLKNEQSRFQVLVKVPYPSKGDRWTDTKRERDPDWYNWQTSLRLVQAYGRSIRSKDDWAKTYVLDVLFGRFTRENRLPGWFMEAIR